MNIVKNNSGYHVIFGMNSEKDAKDTSELIGDYTNIKISKSQGNMDLFKSNISKSKEAKRLVTAQDLKNQDSNDIYILVSKFFKMPIKAKVPYWFKIVQFKGANEIEVKAIAQKEQTNTHKPQDTNILQNSPATAQQNSQKTNESKVEVADMDKQQRDELLKALKIKVDRE